MNCESQDNDSFLLCGVPRISFWSRAMGWLFGCFGGSSRERLPSLCSRGTSHRRRNRDFVNPHIEPSRLHSLAAQLGSRPLLKGEASDHGYLNKSSTLAESLSSSRRTAENVVVKQTSLRETEDAELQILKEEVKYLRSCGISLQTPEELRNPSNEFTRRKELCSKLDGADEAGELLLNPSTSPVSRIHWGTPSQSRNTDNACLSVHEQPSRPVLEARSSQSYQSLFRSTDRVWDVPSTLCWIEEKTDIVNRTDGSHNGGSDIAPVEADTQRIPHSEACVSEEKHSVLLDHQSTSDVVSLGKNVTFGNDAGKESVKVDVTQKPENVGTQPDGKPSAIKLELPAGTALYMFPRKKSLGLRSCVWQEPLSPVKEGDSGLSSEEDSSDRSRKSVSSAKVSPRSSPSAFGKLSTCVIELLSLDGLGKGAASEGKKIGMRSNNKRANMDDDNDENLLLSSLSCSPARYGQDDRAPCLSDSNESEIAPIPCSSPTFSPPHHKRRKHKSTPKIQESSSLYFHVGKENICVVNEKESLTMKDRGKGLSSTENFHQTSSTKLAVDSVACGTVSVLTPVQNVSQWRKLKEGCSSGPSNFSVDSHSVAFRTNCADKQSSDMPEESVEMAFNHYIDKDLMGNQLPRLQCSITPSFQGPSNRYSEVSDEDYSNECCDSASLELGEELNYTPLREDEASTSDHAQSGIDIIDEHGTFFSTMNNMINGPWNPQPFKWFDGAGIPNSTTKYKEDQKVRWHSTPFEVRVERALCNQTGVPHRELFTS